MPSKKKSSASPQKYPRENWLTQAEIARTVSKTRQSIGDIVKKKSVPKRADGKINFAEHGHLFQNLPKQVTQVIKTAKLPADDSWEDDSTVKDLQKRILLQQEKKLKWEAEKKRLEVQEELRNLISKEEVAEFVDRVADGFKLMAEVLPKKILKIAEATNDATTKKKQAEATTNLLMEDIIKKITDEQKDL